MAYIPSHQELKEHPKTRRAARRCGVSIPAMIGHLHLLWWWALDHGPDGDLSRFESEDLADAAMWEGDPEEFVKALVDCGPGGSEGFLSSDGKLHDWAEYGGKYGQRVQAARKAAAVRWQSNGNADASSEQPLDGLECEGNADAMRPHDVGNAAGNAEERRGEKRRKTKTAPDGDADAESFDLFWKQYPRGPAGKPGGDGARKPALNKWRRLSAKEREACLTAVPHYATHIAKPDSPNAAHAITWLNQERWEMWQEPAKKAQATFHEEVCPDCEQPADPFRHNDDTCEAIKSGQIRGY